MMVRSQLEIFSEYKMFHDIFISNTEQHYTLLLMHKMYYYIIYM